MNADMSLGAIEIDEVEQGSPEWKEAKRGIVSASNFHKVLAGGDGKTRRGYMRRIVGEIVSGQPADDYRNPDMDRGNVMEPEIRSQFAFLYDVEPKRVGFVRRRFGKWWIGASPDSLVGDDEIVEYKSMRPDLMLELMERNRPPGEHVAQCQGTMMVTGRMRASLLIGYSGMRPLRFKIARDSSFQARLLVGLATFLEEADAMCEWYEKWRPK